MPDKYFGDSHHLYRLGATRFTRLIGDKVFTHLVQGRLDAIRPVLVPLNETYPDEQREPRREMTARPAPSSTPTLSINGGTRPPELPAKSGE
jgi:hypothetical protein